MIIAINKNNVVVVYSRPWWWTDHVIVNEMMSVCVCVCVSWCSRAGAAGADGKLTWNALVSWLN